MAYKDIVVFVDPSPESMHRLRIAVDLARRCSAHLIGVYVVSFRVPTDTPTGSARNFVVAQTDPSTGQMLFSNGSTIAIQ